MTPLLPHLTERIDRGAAGGHEFERLMHQLLFCYADREGFEYQPSGRGGGDGGVDGLVPQGGIPGLSGPVTFQFKWLWGEIHKGDHARQIESSFHRVMDRGELKNWVLVTPWDLTGTERKWLTQLPFDRKHRIGSANPIPQIYHWGREKIENLLRLCPSLFARYYPHEARALLEGYTGFDFREFARQYRQKVALDNSRLLTLGFPPEALNDREATTEVHLRDVFIQLSLLPESAGRSITIATLLKSRVSPVILGDPGTGKSTLLAFLALLYSGEAELAGFEPPRDLSPFLIRLADYARLQQERPGFSFLDFLTTRARSDYGFAQAHPAFFESALRMGEAIVLLDGLDEVGNETTRHRISNAISALHDEYPTCIFWATSRIYGYTQNVRLPSKRFSTFRICRLEDYQVNDFIERWYALQWPNNERERIERTASLRRAVQRSPSVRRLAGSPLLLTLMAFIHQGLRRLPQDRGELYEKCIEMLLKTWQEAKQPEGEALKHDHPVNKLGLHIHTQKDYLAHLALFAQESNQQESSHEAGEEARGLIPRSEALECLARRHLERSLRTRPELTVGEAREEMEKFLDYIADRTGLLIDRGNGRIAFIHLSFQEYLAAWVFTTKAGTLDSAFFEKYIGVPSWEEVLLLRLYIVLRSPGGGGEQAFDMIISVLLRRLERNDAPEEWLTLARALRDNLDFSRHDQETILRHVLAAWFNAPAFAGNWFTSLEEIALFAERSREALRPLLDSALSGDSILSAVASLYLTNRLFGRISADAASRIGTRGDLQQLLPNVGIFVSEPGFSDLLSNATLKDWFTALSDVDSPASYRLSLRAASCGEKLFPNASGPTAMLALLFRKICREMRSRAQLAVLLQRRAYPGLSIAKPSGLRFVGSYYKCALPLGSLLAGPYAALGIHSLVTSIDSSSALPFPDLALSTLMSIEDGRQIEKLWCSDSWLRRRLNLDESPLMKTLELDLQALVERWVKTFRRSFETHVVPLCNEAGEALSKNFIELAMRAVARVDREFSLGLLGIKHAGSEGSGFASAPESAEILEDSNCIFEFDSNNLFQERIMEEPQLPALLANLWTVALANHALAYGRAFALGKEHRLEVDADLWLLENPAEVHLAAYAWEEHARAYATSHECLSGIEAALLVAHAAYATLMTGIPCDGPVWTDLLSRRRLGEPLLEVSFCLHEVCHLRAAVENLRKIAEMMGDAGQSELAYVLEKAGFSMSGAHDFLRNKG